MGVNVYEYLTFDRKSTADFGVWISGGGTFNAPARDIETISIPGRNGDLYRDNGRYRNITVTYPAFISDRFQPRMDAFRAWLCSHVGYYRLEDSYHPEEYRMGLFKAAVSVSTTVRNLAGTFALSFDCKPQRWLKSGETAIRYTANGTIYNPTMYTADPLITLRGTPGVSGAFNIKGNQQINIKFPDSGTIIIDVENGEAYDTDGANLNNNVSFHASNTAQDFPRIAPGSNAVLMWNVASVEIVPRWWTI